MSGTGSWRCGSGTSGNRTLTIALPLDAPDLPGGGPPGKRKGLLVVESKDGNIVVGRDDGDEIHGRAKRHQSRIGGRADLELAVLEQRHLGGNGEIRDGGQ